MIPNLISVIVPIYNGEAYLERCVRSVLQQEYRDLELILVDGASTDGTLGQCRAWRKEDERIIVIHTPVNRGVSAGRNTGIQKARGEYLFFLDADDWLMPDCLARLYRELQETESDIAGCGFRSCTDRDWETFYRQTGPDGTGAAYHEPARRHIMAGSEFLREGILNRDTRCWSKLYRRSLIEGHYFREDFTIGEDMLFLWEVSALASKISSSTYQGYCYYHNPDGAMLKPFRESDMDQIRCWQVVLDSLKKTENDARVISKTATILAVSCMLVVGKLACLPAKERKRYRKLIGQCSLVLRETLRIPGAYDGLDRGYRLKVGLYRRMPALYLFLYHQFKKAHAPSQ